MHLVKSICCQNTTTWEGESQRWHRNWKRLLRVESTVWKLTCWLGGRGEFREENRVGSTNSKMGGDWCRRWQWMWEDLPDPAQRICRWHFRGSLPRWAADSCWWL